MRIGMIGHGMMGVWHSDALQKIPGVTLRVVAGRRPEPTAEFAARYGYARATTDVGDLLVDPEVDAVIIASPSEQHVEHALRCIEAGKPALVEIPLAMDLASAQGVADKAAAAGVMLAMCHPMRFRAERDPLLARVAEGKETIRHVAGRFFISRLKNVGATGYERSWTDNILWHHFCHFVDLGVQLLGEAPPRSVHGSMSDLHPTTGIPMECVVMVETPRGQSMLVHGSYHSSFRLYDKIIVTDQDTYLYDILAGTLRTRDGTVAIEPEPTNLARVTADFVAAVRDGRPPRAPVASALPAMRILQEVQGQWDSIHGARALPGRALGPA